MIKKEFDKLLEQHNKENEEYLGKNADYKDLKYKCKKCDSIILTFEVFHSIHDGFSMFKEHTGSGRVWKELRPFCPVCDGKNGEKLNYNSSGECIDY